MAKMTSTNNGKAKMHAELLFRIDQWPTELKGCTKHTEFRHGEHMECGGMNGDMVNQDEKHQ
jgi:hypothetical protein